MALWADIVIAYITLNLISKFLRQFYPGDLTTFAGSTIIFFITIALIIRWFRDAFHDSINSRDGTGFCHS